jgi:hypothetical protein
MHIAKPGVSKEKRGESALFYVLKHIYHEQFVSLQR